MGRELPYSEILDGFLAEAKKRRAARRRLEDEDDQGRTDETIMGRLTQFKLLDGIWEETKKHQATVCRLRDEGEPMQGVHSAFVELNKQLCYQVLRLLDELKTIEEAGKSGTH